MTLFDGKSALVVGAGGSCDLKLPLGRELWDLVSSDVFVMSTAVGKLGANLQTAKVSARWSDPKSFAYVSAMMEHTANDQQQLSPSLVAEIVGADRVYSNVDEFVRNHPSIAAPITALVAANLFEKLYALKEDTWVRKPELLYPKLPNRARGGHINNWMTLFVGLCREWLSAAEPAAPLQVISFNYDRIFETVLRECWEKSELQYPAFDSCFKFRYPHGAFSQLPLQCPDPAEFLAAEYKNFGLAGSSTSVKSDIAEAIALTGRVFFVGFSFAPANVSLLGLAESDFQKIWINGRLRVQNYGGKDIRLTRTLEGLFPGRGVSDTEPGGADELVSNGFFEH